MSGQKIIRAKMHFPIYDCFTCKLARINQYRAPTSACTEFTF